VLEGGVVPGAQLDRELEARQHGSSTVAVRSRGAHSARLEEQSDGIGSFFGALLGGRQLDAEAPLGEVRTETHGRLLWWLARWSSIPRASSSEAVAQGGRAERNGSGERVAKLGFSSNVKAGIGVAVDKAEHVASETAAMEFGGRRRGSVATRGESSDEATACAFKRWVRLTSGPHLFLFFLKIFKHPNFEIYNGDLPAVYNSPNFV
jgi:hypothetical protein